MRTGQDLPLLAHFEKEQDVEQTMKLLRKLKSDEELRQEAKQNFHKRRYVSALVRYMILNDKEGTGICLFKMKDYKQAIPFLIDCECHYEAGVSIEKQSDFKNAALHYLKTTEDRDHNFAKVLSCLNRVQDWQWLYGQADKFFVAAMYEQTLLFLSVVQHPAMEGMCHLLLGKRRRAEQVWNRYNSLSIITEIANFALHKHVVDKVVN